MDNNLLIKQYQENKQKIKSISEERDIFNKKGEEEIHHLERDIYDKKIQEIMKERDGEIDKIEMRIKNKRDESHVKIEELNKIISKVERILALFNIFRENDGTNFEVYMYSDGDERGNYLSESRKIILKPIEILQDDEFKKIAVYIVENDKPKNKYSLIIRGRSIFAWKESLELKNYMYGSYISGVHEDGCNIETTLKDSPTEKELLEWYAKNKNKILKEFLEKHQEVENEYKEAIILYEQRGWKILYLENQKEYYEKHYGHGTDTEEYNQVLKELNEVLK